MSVQAVKVDYRSSTRARDGTRKVTYQLELIRCGKNGCRCKSGSLHGPYWFAYWRHVGRKRKRYIGAQLKLLTFGQLRAMERRSKREAAVPL